MTPYSFGTDAFDTGDTGDTTLEEAYSRVINYNKYRTAGISTSFSGAGINNVVGAGAPTWTGGFVNAVVNF
jgi:hypothetical protein